MIPCVLVGDSIAVGVGQFRPECETIAKVGINSERYIATYLPATPMSVDTAVISLGVNDDASLDTLTNLREVRGRIAGNTVYWLLPGLKPAVRNMIMTVAQEHGDRLIDTRPQAGPDHLHPTGAGYRYIASLTTGDADGQVPVETAEYAPRERVSMRGATPAQRIRRLRTLRLSEGPVPIASTHRQTQRHMRVTAKTTPGLAAHHSSPRATAARTATARIQHAPTTKVRTTQTQATARAAAPRATQAKVVTAKHSCATANRGCKA